jgi:hypothetical protein
MLSGSTLERPNGGRYTKKSAGRVDIMLVVFRFTVHVFFYSLVFFFTVVCDTSKVGAGFIIFCGLVVKYAICYMISDMKLQ